MKKHLFIFLFTGLGLLQAQMPFEYVVLNLDFENGTDSIISLSNDSMYSTHWQMGQPSKTNFNSAYSGSNAMVTDTLSPYLPNTYTYFEIPFMPNYLSLMEPICPLNFCFQHKLDIDSLHAGAWIDVWDNDEFRNIADFDWGSGLLGNNYLYAQVQTDYGYTTWDSIYNGEPGFHMNIQNWTKVCYSLFWIGVSPPRSFDTIYFRFNFMSDSTANVSHEGWIIDDIEIGKGFGWCGGGINDEINSAISIFPNPTKEVVFVHVNMEFMEGSYEVVDLMGRIIDSKVVQYSESIPIHLEHLSPGTYFIRFNLDGKQGVRKLIKQ